jgi:hypothetical protein
MDMVCQMQCNEILVSPVYNRGILVHSPMVMFPHVQCNNILVGLVYIRKIMVWFACKCLTWCTVKRILFGLSHHKIRILIGELVLVFSIIKYEFWLVSHEMLYTWCSV